MTEEQKTEAEIRTIDTLLDRGVQVDIPAPRLFRLFGKKVISFVVKSQDSETILKISGLYLKMKLKATTLDAATLDDVHLMIAECMKPASRIVAYGIKPTVTPLGLRNRLLAWYLRRNLSVRRLTELWVMVAGMSGAHDFPNFIRLLSGMRITMPTKAT